MWVALPVLGPHSSPRSWGWRTLGTELEASSLRSGVLDLETAHWSDFTKLHAYMHDEHSSSHVCLVWLHIYQYQDGI